MVPHRSLLVAVVLTGVAAAASGQAKEAIEGASLKRVTQVKHRVYDLATRQVVRDGAPPKGATATYCYVNTDTAGVFFPFDLGQELVDWGVLGGTQGTQCLGLSTIVSSFGFAYATSALDPAVGGPGAALTLTFYTDWMPYGGGLNAPVATFAFTGLPGHSGASTGVGSSYVFTVDVSGGSEFSMPDGRFGYGFRGEGKTGPLLCFTGDGLGGPEPVTGNMDEFDLWVPDTSGSYAGTYFFGGPPANYTSWHAAIARADLTPSQVVQRAGGTAVPGSLACSSFRLGESFDLTAAESAGHLAAFALAFDSPFQLTLGGGQTVLCIDLGGNGELYTGSGLALSPVGGGIFVGGAVLPTNLELCGFTFCTQVIFAFGASPFGLSSACDVTVGG